MRPGLLLLVLTLSASSALAAPCPAPKTLAFVVEKTVHRSKPGFTEGLEIQGGALMESTGDVFGNSGINRIDLKTGHVQTLLNAGRRYFGEGLTEFAGRYYQMTYTEHRVFVFDAHLKPLHELTNPREGWGLTHDATRLIASDGSDKLFFLSPDDFSTLETLPVLDQDQPVRNLNELEYVRDAIWANVFEHWTVLKISPRTGCVEAKADITPLRGHMTGAERAEIAKDDNFVPNGIAFDAVRGQFVLTGKYWPMLFFGQFVEVN
jgi:glutaminyl-peptide cyclotransferase